MIINKIGKYELTQDIKTSNACGVGTLLKGTVLNITQIDETYHRVISNELMDWTYWDMPVIPI